MPLRFLVAFIVFALCSPTEGQQAKKVPRIGFLGITSPSTVSARLEAFRRGLRALRYVITIPPTVLARADRVIK